MRTLPARRLKAKPAGSARKDCQRRNRSPHGRQRRQNPDRTVRHVQQADWEDDSFLRLNLTPAGMVIQLNLTTLAGMVIQLSASTTLGKC